MLTFTEKELNEKFKVLKGAKLVTLFYISRLESNLSSVKRFRVGAVDAPQDYIVSPRTFVGLPSVKEIDCHIEEGIVTTILEDYEDGTEDNLDMVLGNMQSWIPLKEYLQRIDIPYCNTMTVKDVLSTHNFTNMLYW